MSTHAPSEPPQPPKSVFDKLSEFANNMDSRAWRAVAISIVMALVALAILIIGRFYFAEEVEAFIDGTLGEARRGHWGLVAAIVVFTLTAYVGAPQIVLIGACVVAFGPELGFWNAWLATIVSGAATYSTGRLASAQTQKRFGGATGGRFTRFMGKNGFLASLIVRFVPTAPFVVVNMAFGAARVNFWAYLCGLAIGVLPKTVIIAFAGDSIMDALQGEFLAALVMGVLAVGLWLLVVVIVRRWLRREQNQVEADEA
ncbi:TVP38/TMEM64 family protein [Terricaulis silvestris]|uniref:TVP38/TMEM64 family membrane protein n=1 Tax=Terricaulis silvestris TaxID=2686094 RepID=A0A6I6MXF3_9CAUL|nr:VTT domain-containing protein [Terricaulis silvestris]QGZ95873.1 membrane protein YqaA [Terricaulis silvestris]